MPRLAVLVDTFPRWSERFIARELTALVHAGVDLTVFCLRAGTLPSAESDADWTEIADRRVVLPACVLGTLLHSGNEEAERRQSLARSVLGLRHRSRIACAQKFAALLREGNFRHLHAHFGNLTSTIAWLAAGEVRIPLSVSLHARDVFVEAQLLREKFQDCNRVFACSERARAHLLTQLEIGPMAREKLVLMRHGLPLKQFEFHARKPGASVRILAAGRFVPKKGFSVLIQALAHPALQKRSFKAMLLGEGPEERKLSGLIRRLGLKEKVELCEPLGGAALREAFQSADLFVAPYLTAPDGDMDGVPNVVLEAFALGLPVIGTDAGGLGEALTSETGTRVAENDVEALANALAQFLADPGAALSKTLTARDFVEREYNMAKNIEPLLRCAASRAKAC